MWLLKITLASAATKALLPNCLTQLPNFDLTNNSETLVKIRFSILLYDEIHVSYNKYLFFDIEKRLFSLTVKLRIWKSINSTVGKAALNFSVTILESPNCNAFEPYCLRALLYTQCVWGWYITHPLSHPLNTSRYLFTWNYLSSLRNCTWKDSTASISSIRPAGLLFRSAHERLEAILKTWFPVIFILVPVPSFWPASLTTAYRKETNFSSTSKSLQFTTKTYQWIFLVYSRRVAKLLGKLLAAPQFTASYYQC